MRGQSVCWGTFASSVIFNFVYNENIFITVQLKLLKTELACSANGLKMRVWESALKLIQLRREGSHTPPSLDFQHLNQALLCSHQPNREKGQFKGWKLQVHPSLRSDRSTQLMVVRRGIVENSPTEHYVRVAAKLTFCLLSSATTEKIGECQNWTLRPKEDKCQNSKEGRHEECR